MQSGRLAQHAQAMRRRLRLERLQSVKAADPGALLVGIWHGATSHGRELFEGVVYRQALLRQDTGCDQRRAADSLAAVQRDVLTLSECSVQMVDKRRDLGHRGPVRRDPR
jgi:hypothetical protein